MVKVQTKEYFCAHLVTADGATLRRAGTEAGLQRMLDRLLVAHPETTGWKSRQVFNLDEEDAPVGEPVSETPLGSVNGGAVPEPKALFKPKVRLNSRKAEW
jgi:hypothetical protein